MYPEDNLDCSDMALARAEEIIHQLREENERMREALKKLARRCERGMNDEICRECLSANPRFCYERAARQALDNLKAVK